MSKIQNFHTPPGLPLQTRKGERFFWSPFEIERSSSSDVKAEHNYNVCIAGQSGSGKSRFAKELIKNVLSVGGRAIVLDHYGEFKETCQALKGDPIELSLQDSSRFNFNPFAHIPSGDSSQDQEARLEMLACLRGILETLVSAPQDSELEFTPSPRQLSYLDQALSYAWEQAGTEADFSLMREYLIQLKDAAADPLIENLALFVPEGQYGALVTGGLDEGGNEDFVVIETSKLRSHSAIASVFIQLSLVRFFKEITKGAGDRPTLIVIEEPWKVFSGNTATFMSEMTRLGRKHKVSFVFVSGVLTDYLNPQSTGLEDFFQSAEWKVLFPHESYCVDAFRNYMPLHRFVDTKNKENKLKSLAPKFPDYSEFMIVGPETQEVSRLSLNQALPKENSDLKNVLPVSNAGGSHV